MNILKFFKSDLIKRCLKDIRTWSAWIALLKALFGLKMTKKEVALYTEYTGREERPQGAFRELFVVAGRRSGKSFISALVAVFLGLFFDYKFYLGPGEHKHRPVPKIYPLYHEADRSAPSRTCRPG